jgi:hypothetical protein
VSTSPSTWVHGFISCGDAALCDLILNVPSPTQWQGSSSSSPWQRCGTAALGCFFARKKRLARSITDFCHGLLAEVVTCGALACPATCLAPARILARDGILSRARWNVQGTRLIRNRSGAMGTSRGNGHVNRASPNMGRTSKTRARIRLKKCFGKGAFAPNPRCRRTPQSRRRLNKKRVSTYLIHVN